MSNEIEIIEINEYIRTRGKIGKLIRIERDNIDTFLKWYVFEDGKNERYVNKPYIENHSKNIIDLIEIGDYVNGEYVYKITPGCIYFRGKAPCNKIILNIKTIVTKELFESVEYKVGV